MSGEDVYPVAVIPTFDRKVITDIIRTYIDNKWCVTDETIELLMNDSGDVVSVEVDGRSDEDCFVIYGVDMVGFE